MNDYTKGILTGASLILCFFMFVSAKSQSKNLGDITVSSLNVVNKKGNLVGGLKTTEQSNSLFFLAREDGTPALLFNSDSTKNGFHIYHNMPIRLYNKAEEVSVYLGSPENDGVVFLYDRYGDLNWAETGKK